MGVSGFFPLASTEIPPLTEMMSARPGEVIRIGSRVRCISGPKHYIDWLGIGTVEKLGLRVQVRWDFPKVVGPPWIGKYMPVAGTRFVRNHAPHLLIVVPQEPLLVGRSTSHEATQSTEAKP